MYDDIIDAAATKYPVAILSHDDWVALIKADIGRESNWNASAVGDGGLALGLGQMHASAAEEVGFDWSLMKDPAVAIPAMTAYLAKQINRFGDVAWGLAAYNQGPTVIGKAKRYADAVLALRGA